MLSPTRAYVLIVPQVPQVTNSGAIASLPSVDPAQVQTMAIDWGAFLPPDVDLTGTPTLTLTVTAGTDPSPESRISGGPGVATVPPSVGGTGVPSAAVEWQVSGALAGVDYVAAVSCARSDGDVVEASTRFSCVAPT